MLVSCIPGFLGFSAVMVVQDPDSSCNRFRGRFDMGDCVEEPWSTVNE